MAHNFVKEKMTFFLLFSKWNEQLSKYFNFFKSSISFLVPFVYTPAFITDSSKFWCTNIIKYERILSHVLFLQYRIVPSSYYKILCDEVLPAARLSE